jgi:FMN phosphatase YigB (HAD superfamily)
LKSVFPQPTRVTPAVTFDLFGTLVTVERHDDPAATVARELAARGVAVPEDWATAYGEVHVEAPEGAEVPLPAHVAAALSSRGVHATGNTARRAVVAAFDPDVTVLSGAHEAVAAAAEHGPVGLLSNCAAPETVRRALIRADLREAFDAVVTSVGCGWRKPHPGAFETVAERLGVPPGSLVHVGDDPATDGGVEGVGGRFVDVARTPFASLPGWLDTNF